MSSLSSSELSSASHVASETVPSAAVSSTARERPARPVPSRPIEPVASAERRHLVPCDPLGLGQLDVVCPLVGPAETEGGAQDHQLAQATGQRPRQERAAEAEPTPEELGVGSAQGREDVHRLGRSRRANPRAPGSGPGPTRRRRVGAAGDVRPAGDLRQRRSGHGRIVGMTGRHGSPERRTGVPARTVGAQRSGRNPIGGCPDAGAGEAAGCPRRAGRPRRGCRSATASSALRKRPRSRSASTGQPVFPVAAADSLAKAPALAGTQLGPLGHIAHVRLELCRRLAQGEAGARQCRPVTRRPRRPRPPRRLPGRGTAPAPVRPSAPQHP